MIIKRTSLVLLLMIAVFTVNAQTKITGVVLDKGTREPMIGATITVTGSKDIAAVTDIDGRFSVTVPNRANVTISYIGYKTLVEEAHDGVYLIESQVNALNEVVVTAQESQQLSTSSVIGRQAMDHLQPSSFGDMMELIPGGRAQDPYLTGPNTINLREAGVGDNNYATSSLGTSFIIDGAPISTNANLQRVSGGTDSESLKRDFTNRGVDMRSISTDDIERVEIVRGIPSVEYGDLTSGLVKIERRRGGNNITARLKADMGSYLFNVGKGFEWQPRKLSLNINADYLDSRIDPRNTLENYKRITLSARLHKAWSGTHFNTTLATSVDYTGSFDNDKTDPDLNEGAIDTYESSYNRWALMTSFSLKPNDYDSWFKALNATLSTSLDNDNITREKFIQLRRATIAATSTEQGESDAVILPYSYTTKHEVDGKPFNLFLKVNAKLQVPTERVSNSLLLGVDWNVDKNYGKGQIFDPTLPLYPGISGRPRDISQIPASHTLSLYAEENLKTTIAGNTIEVVAGIRGSHMMNLSSRYALNSKFYWDPRVNIGWTFPQFKVGDDVGFVRLSGGLGEHTKMPTIEHLYPEPVYIDLVQFNYYHPNEAYKRIGIMTYVVDPTNYDLRAARNFKWEVSTDINIAGNRLSVTYFRENMTSGFRSTALYAPYYYKLYDTSVIDGSTITGPPSMEGVPYEATRELVAHSRYSNGSQTKKEGIEYTFASRRIEKIHTRLTINGAWFKTVHRNSVALMERPSQVVGDRQVPFVGIYKDTEGYTDEMVNTNFTLDTDVPRLKLGFSVSAQCQWFTSNQRLPISNYPDQYMDIDGDMHNWTPELVDDVLLRYLIRNNTESMYDLFKVPFSMNINFKVTKKFFNDHLHIAMFCNKIWDYTPNYERDGVTIRRHVTPYFGLEMNIKL
ncbi:MAG: TonB-dependent receptor plug domain-containing protein [Muribaculaceae bacterium]|nr:TonB-dependent receptor plug domain-containing protein [Muribaculaceae bacterium]